MSKKFEDYINTKFEAYIYVENSEMIEAIQYDPMTQVLDAQFKKGKSVYRYKGVTHLEFSLLVTRESVGKAFHAMILGKKKSEKTDRQPFHCATEEQLSALTAQRDQAVAEVERLKAGWEGFYKTKAEELVNACDAVEAERDAARTMCERWAAKLDSERALMIAERDAAIAERDAARAANAALDRDNMRLHEQLADWRREKRLHTTERDAAIQRAEQAEREQSDMAAAMAAKFVDVKKAKWERDTAERIALAMEATYETRPNGMKVADSKSAQGWADWVRAGKWRIVDESEKSD